MALRANSRSVFDMSRKALYSSANAKPRQCHRWKLPYKGWDTPRKFFGLDALLLEQKSPLIFISLYGSNTLLTENVISKRR